MSKAANSKGPSGDDPWEELAEDLFGATPGNERVARSEEPDTEEAPPPAESLEEDVTPVFAEAEEPAEREPFVPAREADEAEESPPTFASEARSELPRATEGEPAARPATTPSAEDSYWDALANWSWDDAEGGAGKRRAEEAPAAAPEPTREEPRSGGYGRERHERRGRRDEGRGRDRRGDRRGGRRGREERPPRPAPGPSGGPAASPPRPAPPRKELPVPEDFGAGVTSEESAGGGRPEPETYSESVSPAAESAGFEAEPVAREYAPRSPAAGGRGPAESEGEMPRKRRRRRRRRGRGGNGERGEGRPAAPGHGPAEPVFEDEEGDMDVEETQAGGRPYAPSESMAEEREAPPPRGSGTFSEGAGWEDEESEAGEAPEVLITTGDSESADLDAGDDADDDSGESVISYDNVPTWEEAISYLLNPAQVQAESGGGSQRGGPPPAEGQRPSRHYGGRKHHRRS